MGSEMCIRDSLNLIRFFSGASRVCGARGRRLTANYRCQISVLKFGGPAAAAAAAFDEWKFRAKTRARRIVVYGVCDAVGEDIKVSARRCRRQRQHFGLAASVTIGRCQPARPTTKSACLTPPTTLSTAANVPYLQQVCFQLPTSSDNVTLPTFGGAATDRGPPAASSAAVD